MLKRTAQQLVAGGLCFAAGTQHLELSALLQRAEHASSSLSSASSSSASPAAAVAGSDDDDVRRFMASAKDVIRVARTKHPASACVLGTVLSERKGGTSVPRLRPVNPMAVQLEGGGGSAPAVFFNTNARSRKYAQLARNGAVSMVFLDADGIGYVNVIGEAEQVPPAEAVSMWVPRQRLFFPEGHADGKGRFTVFRVRPRRLEMISMRRGIDSAEHADWRPLAVDWDEGRGKWLFDESTALAGSRTGTGNAAAVCEARAD